MANLPTAYASQRFGRKTLEFYAVEGDAVGADPRARSEERRLEDMDGQRHTVRLMEKGFALEPGQTATVLRMQPGPARRSRPVALVNHDTASWCRTHPGADGLLAKAGVARTFNWALTMVLFALAALTLVWPFLRAFLVEVDPGLFGGTPDLNVAALAVAALPALSSWSFTDAIAPLTGPLGSAVPALAPLADMLVFGTGVMIAALGVYILRSWRLLWAPLFVGVLGAVSIAYGGPAGMVEPALSGLGLAALLFLTGGVINRIRDGARLEARIAVLADHLLRQGPQDAVVAPEIEAGPYVEPESETAANDDFAGVVPLTAATAASLRATGDTDAAEEVAAEPASIETAEVEAENQDALPVESGSADVVEAIEADAVEPTEEDSPIEAQADAEATTTEVIAPPEPELEASDELNPAEAPETPSEVDADVVATQPEAELEADAPVVDAEPVSVSDDEHAEGAPVEPVEPAQASEAVTPAPQLEADPTDTTPAGLDPEEAERLRTDPRYASRAIVLPPPPPMPGPGSDLGEGSGEAMGQGELTTLKPSAPLPDNVIPIFAAPSSSQLPSSADESPDAPEDEKPRDPA